MGAGQSDLYKDSFGDNINNIPNNVLSKEGRIQSNPKDLLDDLDLTDSQKHSIKTINNTIRDHLKDTDFTGTQGDLEGNPIVGWKGIPFQHLNEMKTSYRTLVKYKKSLEGSLRNPNLGKNEEAILRETLNNADVYINKMFELLNRYGEV